MSLIRQNADAIQKLAADDCYPALSSHPSGLTEEEAKARLQTYGKNVISGKKGKPAIVIFLSNFISLMAI